MTRDVQPADPTPLDWAFHFETGRLCLNFVSTVGDRAHLAFDRWRAPPDLARWCVEAELLGEPPAIAAKQLTQARTLREAIYRSLVAVRAERRPTAPDVALINRWAARPPLVPRLTGRGRTVAWDARAPLDAVLATVARDTIDLLAGADLERLRDCAERSCSVIFVDASRPGRRRWCSMERCGNRAKKASFRARHRAATTSAP
jgi:predicted RNA-binding Zn ribbon-like protein